MKLGQVIDSAFSIALKELSATPVSAATAYKLASLIDRVNEEVTRYNTIRMSLLEKYGQKDKKTGKVKTNKDNTEYLLDNKEKYLEEYNALINVDVDLPTVPLTEISNVTLTANVVRSLKPILTV